MAEIDEGQMSGLLAERFYEYIPSIYLLTLGGERFEVENPALDPDQLLVLIRKSDGRRFSIELDVIVESLEPLSEEDD